MEGFSMNKEIQDRIFAAAEMLYEKKDRVSFPTVDAVRKAAKVNMNDASAGMKAWRSEHTDQKNNSKDVPEMIKQIGKKAINSLWRESEKLATEALRAAQAGWDAERAELESIDELELSGKKARPNLTLPLSHSGPFYYYRIWNLTIVPHPNLVDTDQDTPGITNRVTQADACKVLNLISTAKRDCFVVNRDPTGEFDAAGIYRYLTIFGNIESEGNVKTLVLCCKWTNSTAWKDCNIVNE
jgi:hypothetical protein